MACKVIVKFVRSDGKVLLVDGHDWLIPNDGIKGFGECKATISTIENAIGNGSVVVGKKIPQKSIEIKAYGTDSSRNEELRHIATDFFKSGYQYDTYLTYMGRTRLFKGELEMFACPTRNIYQKVFFEVAILCPEPFLRSVNPQSKFLSTVLPMAGFPYLCAENIGRPTGVIDLSRRVRIFNDGDVPTYCNVVFEASGDVTNPKLVINGKYVRVLTELHQFDKLAIDFTGTPSVTLNGENIIGRTDRTSTFDDMYLRVGENIIEYDSDTGNTSLEVTVYYNNKYETM